MSIDFFFIFQYIMDTMRAYDWDVTAVSHTQSTPVGSVKFQERYSPNVLFDFMPTFTL
jgi:hypothetical protein